MGRQSIREDNYMIRRHFVRDKWRYFHKGLDGIRSQVRRVLEELQILIVVEFKVMIKERKKDIYKG